MNRGWKTGTVKTEDRSMAERHAAPAPRLCDLCRSPVVERHCKVVCLNCGYQRDCSDP